MTPKLHITASILFATLICAFSISAQVTLSGKVIDVIDGDTVVIEIPSGKFEATLQFIETPTREQALFETVKHHLKNLVFGKVVAFRARTISYEASTGQLTLNGTDMSEQMLRDGAAWHIPIRFSAQQRDEHARYASHEAAAKNEKRGIWAVKNLMPSWEVRISSNSQSTNENKQSIVDTPNPQKSNAGKWGDKNPLMGNVGALLNGYNAESKTGYLSTVMMRLEDADKGAFGDHKLAIDFSYFYKQEEKGRKGTFVFTVVSLSKKGNVLGNNNLWLVGEKTNINLGKPKRTSSKKDGDDFREVLIFEINRSSIERIVNNDGIYMKIGNHIIQLMGSKYLLYNMLQLSQ